MPTRTRKNSNTNRVKKTENENEHDYGDELRERVGDIGNDVRALASTAGSAAREQLDPIEQYVHDKPVRSLLIAAGVGALVSFFFLRR